jgi:hypothetical protein
MLLQRPSLCGRDPPSAGQCVSWYVHTYPNGRQAPHRIGDFWQMSLDEAERLAKAAVEAASEGVNPNAARRQAKEAARARRAADAAAEAARLKREAEQREIYDGFTVDQFGALCVRYSRDSITPTAV